MSVGVQRLDDSLRGAWQAYVLRKPEGTFFHGLPWHDAVTSAFGHAPYYLIALRAGEITGVLPLVHVRSWIAGGLLVSVPYAVYGGALFDDDEAGAALLNHAKDLAAELRVRCIDLRSVRAVHPDLAVIDRYATFRKPLPQTSQEVLPNIPRKARAAARAAREKFALTVEFNDDLLPLAWHLYARSMRRLGSINYPFRFFKALVENTPGEHLVQIVRYQNRPAAALVSFMFRDTMLPYFSGCDERYDRYNTNNLMYLTSMEKAVELGYRQYDFGRSRQDNTGPYDFKRHQGFEPATLGYQVYVPPGQSAPNLRPGSGGFALAQKVYACLPLCLTKPLGGWLAKSIPG